MNRIVEVLHDGGEDDLAVAILDYTEGGIHNPETVAMRWNGSNDDPVGFPSVRQYPVWFIVPEVLATTVKFLAEQHFQYSLPFEKVNGDRFMSLCGSQFSTESLLQQLKTRGYKITLEV